MNSVLSVPQIRKRRVKGFNGRGVIYSWLRAHAGQIGPLLASGEISWSQICAEIVRHGVVGPAEVPRSNAALRVWQRVCRDLDACAQADQAKPKRVGATPPSKLPKDWRPSGFASPHQHAAPPAASAPGSGHSPSPAATPPATAVAGSPAGPTVGEEGMSEHAKEQNRRLDEAFRKHDSRYRW